VSGRPRLLGVAYMVPLLPGESAPDWPVGREAWHDHFRTLEDETMLPQHAAPQHHAAGHAPRLAMLHAWIWLDNPAGAFAADNWALPHFRLGIEPDPGAPESAAKALSLVSGGAAYFAASIHASVPLTSAEGRKIDDAFARSRLAVETLLRGRPDRTPTASESESLSEVWTRLWKAVDSSVNRKARASLQQLSIR
jgi:hypothetical protein